MIVNFGVVSWDRPSMRLAPIFKTLSHEEIYQGWTFRVVDVEEASDIAEACGISVNPTVKMYKNGEEIAELLGATEEKLRVMFEENA